MHHHDSTCNSKISNLQKRLKALNFSTTMNQEVKERAREVMTVEYMSSKESTAISGDELEAGNGRKPICRTVPWRSEEATGLMRALGRNYTRRQTLQDKA